MAYHKSSTNFDRHKKGGNFYKMKKMNIFLQ